MRRFINILVFFKEYVVLSIFIVISIVLLGTNDNRQVRFIRSYAVGLVGAMQHALSVIPNVFELRHENEVLRQLNVNLSDEVNRLREAQLENVRLRSMIGLREQRAFNLVPADVVGKSLHLLRNTITLDVGEADGIKTDMPMLAESGLAGKVIVTSPHYSIGQLLINKDFRASAKIERSRVDGIIVWDGGDHLRLTNVSKTQDVKEGDIVMTSEYSNLFPRNIRIGTVARVEEKPGTLFKDVDVAPGVDFSSLEQVFVVAATADSERVQLERRAVRTK